MDGVEDAAEVDERREHEGRYDVDGVHGFCVDAVDEPCEREYECGKHCEPEDDEDVVYGEMESREECRDEKHDSSHQYAAHDASRNESQDKEPWRGRGDENLIDAAEKEFGLEESE